LSGRQVRKEVGQTVLVVRLAVKRFEVLDRLVVPRRSEQGSPCDDRQLRIVDRTCAELDEPPCRRHSARKIRVDSNDELECPRKSFRFGGVLMQLDQTLREDEPHHVLDWLVEKLF